MKRLENTTLYTPWMHIGGKEV